MGERIERQTLAGVDFHGCDSQHSGNCACATWSPVVCVACEEELSDGDDAYIRTSESALAPWLPDDHPAQEIETWVDTWHVTCDEREAR